MGPTLYLACNAEHYVIETGECTAPYYSLPPSFLPPLTLAEGIAWSAAIVGVWTVGVCARLLIRTADKA